ncbi:hypothetical protein [Candidatus Methylomicrobium oryzae]|jgi:hypothetical protein|nr:hypothetical protein [Methylomicrobium sp. RS1]
MKVPTATTLGFTFSTAPEKSASAKPFPVKMQQIDIIKKIDKNFE